MKCFLLLFLFSLQCTLFAKDGDTHKLTKDGASMQTEKVGDDFLIEYHY